MSAGYAEGGGRVRNVMPVAGGAGTGMRRRMRSMAQARPTRRRWFQFGLGTMLVGVALCGLGTAVFGKWVVAVAVLAAVELGLVMTTGVLMRLSERLDQRGRILAGFYVGVVGMMPLVAALFVFILALLAFTLTD